MDDSQLSIAADSGPCFHMDEISERTGRAELIQLMIDVVKVAEEKPGTTAIEGEFGVKISEDDPDPITTLAENPLRPEAYERLRQRFVEVVSTCSLKVQHDLAGFIRASWHCLTVADELRESTIRLYSLLPDSEAADAPHQDPGSVYKLECDRAGLLLAFLNSKKPSIPQSLCNADLLAGSVVKCLDTVVQVSGIVPHPDSEDNAKSRWNHAAREVASEFGQGRPPSNETPVKGLCSKFKDSDLSEDPFLQEIFEELPRKEDDASVEFGIPDVHTVNTH